MVKIKTKWILGGFQAHQNWSNKGICTTLTAAMGMGGGYIPVILEVIERKTNEWNNKNI